MNKLGVKFGIGAIATTLALIASGCGASTPTKPKTTATPSGPVTISFMEAMSSGRLAPALQHLVTEFEATYPNITVDLVAEPSYTVLQQKEEAAIAGGDPPTIGQAYENWAASYASSKAIIPLASFISGSNGITAAQKSEFWAGIWKDLYLPDGKIWMWPFNKSDFVMYYNSTMLTADGISVPKTWNEFASAAKAATKNGDWGVSMDPGNSAGPANGGEWFLSLINAYGGHWVVNGKPDFDSPAAVTAATYLQSLVKAGAVKVGTNYPGQTALGAGKGAFDLSTIASYGYNLAAIGGKFPMGVAAFPSGPAGQGNALEGTNVVIFSDATTAQRDAGWTFMKWLTEPAQTAYWATQTGYLPVTKSALPLMKSYDAAHPYQEIAAESLTYAVGTPAYGWFTQAEGDLMSALESILINNANPSSALKSAQQQALAVESSAG